MNDLCLIRIVLMNGFSIIEGKTAVREKGLNKIIRVLFAHFAV